MTDITQALRDYNKTQKRGNLFSEGSTESFLEYIGSNASAYPDAQPEQITVLANRRNQPLGNIVADNMVGGDESNYYNRRDFVLSTLDRVMGDTTPENSVDPGYFKEQIGALPSGDAKTIRAFLGDEINPVKTLADLRQVSQRLKQKRISKFFPEGDPEREAIEREKANEGGVFTKVGNFASEVGEFIAENPVTRGQRVAEFIGESFEGVRESLKRGFAEEETTESIDKLFNVVDEKANAPERETGERLREAARRARVVIPPEAVANGRLREGFEQLGTQIKERLAQSDDPEDAEFAKFDEQLDNIPEAQPITAEDVKELTDNLNTRKELGENEIIQQIANSENVGEALGRLYDNPSAFRDVLLESAPDLGEELGSQVLGSLFGGFLGSAVGPGGIAGGAVTGGVTASTPVIYSNTVRGYLSGRMQKDLQDQGKEITAENVADYVNTDAFRLARNDAETYATVITTASAGSNVLGFGAASSMAGKLAGRFGIKAANQGNRVTFVVGRTLDASASIATDTAGEVAGKTAIDEEIKVGEVVLQGVANVPSSAVDVASGVVARRNNQETPVAPDGVTTSGFKEVAKDTPDSFDETALQNLASANRTFSEGGRNRYNLTNEELVDLRLVSRPPEGVDLGKHVANSDNWIEGTSPQWLVQTENQDIVFQRLSEKRIREGIEEGNITNDSSAEDINTYVTAVRSRGFDAVDADIKAERGLDADSISRVRNATAENDFSNRNLVDTPESAEARAEAQQGIQNEEGFIQLHRRETGGEGDIRRATAAYKAINETEGTLQQRYAAGAKAYRKGGKKDKKYKSVDQPFADLLEGLSRENIPITPDQNKIGQTGISTREVLDSIQNDDSDFYKALGQNTPVPVRRIQGAVKTGNIGTVISTLREVAPESTQYQDLLNSIANQLDEVDLDPVDSASLQSKSLVQAEVETARTLGPTGRFRPTVERQQTAYYQGAKPEYDGSADSGRDVLNYVHGQQLRERLGNYDYVKSNVITNSNVRAQQVVDIVNNATNSSDALSQLSTINSKPLRNQIADLVNERERLDTGQLSQDQVQAKLDDPNSSLLVDNVDNSILRGRPVEETQTRVEDVLGLNPEDINNISRNTDEPITKKVADDYIKSKKVVREQRREQTGFIRENLNKIGGLLRQDEGLFDAENNSLRPGVINSDVNRATEVYAKGALNFVESSLQKLGIKRKKLSDADRADFNNYLKGERNTVDPKFYPMLDKMRSEIDNNSNIINESLVRTQERLSELGVDIDFNELQTTLTANLNQYVTRSYQAFDRQKQWNKDINDPKSRLRRDTIGDLMNNENLTEADANNALDDLIKFVNDKSVKLSDQTSRGDLTPDDLFKGQTGNLFQGTSYSNLRERVNVSSWVRTALGEIDDGTYNYVNTIRRQKQIIGEIEKDIGVVDMLTNAGVILPKGETSRGFSAVTPNHSIFNKFSPMQGIKIRDDVLNYLQDVRNQEKSDPKYRALNTINYALKYKTLIANIPSHATQYIGAAGFLVQHSPHLLGNIRPIMSGMSEFNQAFRSGDLTDINELTKVMSEAGILDSAGNADVKALLNISNDVDASSFRKATDKLLDLYGTPDRVIKTMSFFSFYANEKKAIRSDNPNISEADLNSQAMRQAADVIGDILPTPQRSIRLIKLIRNPRSPVALAINALVANPFMTHSFEIPRNLLNNARYIRDNINSDNIHRQRMATSMLVGNSILAGSTAALLSYGLNGVDNEDEIPLVEAQAGLSDVAQGEEGTPLYADEEGNFRYRKTEFINNYSMFTNMVNYAMNPNLNEKEKLTGFLQIARNNTLGGSLALDTYNKIIEAVENTEKSSDGYAITSLKVLETVLGNGTTRILRNFIESNGLTENPNDAGKFGISNNALKLARFNEEIVPRDQFYASIGDSIKDRYSARDTKLNKDLIKDLKDFNVEDFSNRIDELAQAKLDAVWENAPLISKSESLIIGKVDESQYNSMINILVSESGLKKPQIVEILRAYRQNPDVKPDPIDLGLDDIGKPKTRAKTKSARARVRDRISENIDALKQYRRDTRAR